MTALESLFKDFPLTLPIPTPKSHSELLTTKDIHREEDLVRNQTSFRAWWTAINNARDAFITKQKLDPGTSELPKELVLQLGPLATPFARLSLQRMTYMYECAIAQFPGSFKLWKAYLILRCSFVLGKFIVKKKTGGKKKLPEMKDALEEENEDLERWEGGLDGLVGWEEWRALVATFERALMWLPKLPRLWTMYLAVFNHPLCPAQISLTHARRTYDRALRTLPPSLHHRIWVRYLLWAESKGGMTMVSVYRRYLAIDPTVTERYAALLLSPSNPEPRPLEAAKLLLALARKAARNEYHSPDSKSPYQLLGEFLDVVEQYAEEVGLDVEETNASHANQEANDNIAMNEANAVKEQPERQVMMFGAPLTKDLEKAKVKWPYDEDEDPISTRRLNIERIIERDGLALYKDQAGRLWTGLATYWIKRGDFDRAKVTFEKGIASVLTIRDFVQIFDAYSEFSMSLIDALMESLESEDDEEEAKATEIELDERAQAMEDLTDRRPFLVNDVLLRRNPNDVQEWEKRVALWGNDDEKVVATYTKAIETITPRKATPNFHHLYVNFAKFYEEGGTTGEAEPDLNSARRILEKATKVNFRTVEDLAEIWCEWAEMEVRNENYDEGIRVMQRAAGIPKNMKINYHDHSLPVQARLFKSLKLWSFYVDLEESLGTVESAKAVYDKILELRIANAQIIINYAAFLEENEYFEDSFKVYERGVELFTFPVSFEIWNIYLSKFVKRYGGKKLERARDLFEQALEKCPAKSCKPLFLMYGQLEEDYGLAKRAMAIYERATQVVADIDKFEMFTIYIAKATANYGLPATRSIYERALEVLPDRQTAEMCLRFAALERKLGEIDRARAIYAHAAQFCDPRTNPVFWKEWNSFEIETGSEDTFREMLRIKRSVQAQFNTETSYLAAQTMAARNEAQAAVDGEEENAAADPMAAMERQANKGDVGAAPRGPSFVAATETKLPSQVTNGDDSEAPSQAPNVEEIHISDDEE